MALHQKQAKTAKQIRARRAKPSRAKRIGRRWDERVNMMQHFLAMRDYAFAVWPVVRRMLPNVDEKRALRIGLYLQKRAQRTAIT